MLAGPLLGSRGVLENMSGWNAAGKLLDPSLLGLSGSATITGDGGGGDGGGGEGGGGEGGGGDGGGDGGRPEGS